MLTPLIYLLVLPTRLSHEQLQTSLYFVLYVFYLLVLIISGLQITNNAWTATTIERKNKGSFIANLKLINVLETKSIIKIRII